MTRVASSTPLRPHLNNDQSCQQLRGNSYSRHSSPEPGDWVEEVMDTSGLRRGARDITKSEQMAQQALCPQGERTSVVPARWRGGRGRVVAGRLSIASADRHQPA